MSKMANSICEEPEALVTSRMSMRQSPVGPAGTDLSQLWLQLQAAEAPGFSRLFQHFSRDRAQMGHQVTSPFGYWSMDAFTNCRPCVFLTSKHRRSSRFLISYLP